MSITNRASLVSASKYRTAPVSPSRASPGSNSVVAANPKLLDRPKFLPLHNRSYNRTPTAGFHDAGFKVRGNY